MELLTQTLIETRLASHTVNFNFILIQVLQYTCNIRKVTYWIEIFTGAGDLTAVLEFPLKGCGTKQVCSFCRRPVYYTRDLDTRPMIAFKKD